MGRWSIAHFNAHPCMTIHKSIDVAGIAGEAVSPGMLIINQLELSRPSVKKPTLI